MTIVNVIATETTAVTAAPEATKDAGRVKLGSGAMHFSDPAPVRDATKDAGRVKLGSGAIQF